MDVASWSAFLIPLFTGGVFGSIITQIATNQRSQRDYALKLIERYIDKVFDQQAKAKVYLVNPTLMSVNANWNEATAVANWFELVASSICHSLADRATLDSLGLPEQCREYYAMMLDAKVLVNGKPGPAYPPADLKTFRYLRWIST